MSESAPGVPADAGNGIGWTLSRDERLAKRAAAGDDRAFEALFKRYQQPLYRYCRAILNEPVDAEDAVQATMVKALRALPGERREIALKPWLYRVAHNESISILRARRETAGLEAAEVAAGSSMELTVEMRERVRTLVADLATLPDRQRASLVMRELSDLSYDEIAAALSTSPAAAKQSVYEARTALLEVAEGREMDCAKAREAISAGDRRVLRGRKLRAHLRGCEGCSDFERAIAERRETLAALAPPLAAPAALALLHGALGGGSAGTGAAGAAGGAGAAGVAGAGLAGGAAVKGAVAVLAVAVVGGGAAATGVLDRDRDAGGSAPASQPPAPADGPAPAAAPAGAAAEAGSQAAGDVRGGNGDGRDQGHGAGQSHANGAGNSEHAPGQTGETPSADAPGQTGTSPGQSGATPAQGAAPPGQSGAAPGQTHSSSGGSGQATAPGQTGTSPGNSESAPGHTDAAATSGSNDNGNAVGHATAPGQVDK
jgi:RNA polymerase sigma factor (sigma-70 family)